MSTKTEKKDWQKGYELDYLKQFGRLFKQCYKGYTFGAFGTPNERDVADRMSKDQVTCIHEKGELVACALYRTLKSSSKQQDFTGRMIEVPAGSLMVDHFAATDCPTFGKELLDDLVSNVPENDGLGLLGGPRPVYLEVHEENAQAKDLAMGWGKYAFTKILASSDVLGVYSRNARTVPPLSGAEEAHLACLNGSFLTEREQGAILKELQVADEVWADHYSSYNRRHTWTAFALKGYDPKDPGFIIKPAEMSKKWKEENPTRLEAKSEWTEMAKRFPTTMKVVARLPGEKDRVRFMRLAAKGGELTRHADITDREAGVADGKVSRLHIPLKSPKDCAFRSWSARGQVKETHLAERGLFYLDQRKPHAVKNPGEQERVHLVVDCYSGPELRKWLEQAK